MLNIEGIDHSKQAERSVLSEPVSVAAGLSLLSSIPGAQFDLDWHSRVANPFLPYLRSVYEFCTKKLKLDGWPPALAT